MEAVTTTTNNTGISSFIRAPEVAVANKKNLISVFQIYLS